MAVLSVVNEIVTLVSEVLAISETISETVTYLKSVGGISARFPSDIETIRSRLESYEEQINIHGARVNGNVVKKLETTKLTLSDAESKILALKNRFQSNQCCFLRWWLYVKLYLTSFSAQLDEPIRSVNKALEDIIKIMEEEIKLKVLWQQDADLRPRRTRIANNDDLYVPIEESQEAVLTAIETEDDRRSIVLLHGGVGKGKSTLARYVHKHYENKKEKFEYVLFVNCAGSSKLDPSNKQREILQRLSPASLTSANPESEQSDFNTRIADCLHDFFLSGKKILIILDDVADPHFISAMLKASEGTQVKYFVTSQHPDLCLSYEKCSILIPMTDPNENEAKAILATLARLDDNVIPEKLQRIADKMIKATGGNPLALACLASNFTNQDKRDVRAWREAYKVFDQILGDPEKLFVLGGTSDGTPSRSLWAAMKICVDSLKSRDVKEVLFLMYACEGESVPEEVLKILHAATKTSGGMFFNSIQELRSRELLKVSASTIAPKLNLDGKDQPDESEAMSWSLLTTVKLYIDQHVAGDEKMRSVFSALRGDVEIKAVSSVKHHRSSEIEEMETEKSKVAIALCALYFDRDHTDKHVKEAATWACNASHMIDWNPTIKDRRRKAIEPLIWLMNQSKEDAPTWTESHVHCVRQVFLRYVCDMELDDSNICVLLNLTRYPSAQLAMLIALYEILDIEEIPLLQIDRLTFLQPLVHILKTNEGVKPNVQEAAWKALRRVTWKAATADKAIGTKRRISDSIVTSMPHLLPMLERSLQQSLASPTPLSDARAEDAASILKHLDQGLTDNGAGLLASLVQSLSADENPTLQLSAGKAIMILGHCDTIGLRILGQDGLLEGLVWAMSKDENPSLQENGAWALGNLADGPNSIRVRILGQDGAFQGLIRALSKESNPALQAAAASTLRRLANGAESVKLKISGVDGALAGLVESLSKDQNPRLQKNAAWAFANLANGPNSIRLRILGQDGALQGLIRALSKESNPELQAAAASTLRRLANGMESIKLKISGADGALAGLVESLSKDQNPRLQKNAAWAFANLACESDSIRLSILGQDGALSVLVESLSKDKNPLLPKTAAWALGNLAEGQDTIKHQISCADRALAALVESLSKDEDPHLQKNAARALGNLAKGQDTIKHQISSANGALASLVKSLSQDHNPDLQENAACALRNLASGSDSVTLHISDQDSVLRGLVRALSKDKNPSLQKHAAWALGHLVGGPDSVRLRILSQHGVLKGLIGALSKEQNPELQTAAACTLGRLANGTESVMLQISGAHGALPSLVKSLSKDKNPCLQKYAAWALGNLAKGQDTIKHQISCADGALAGLVKSLSKDENPHLQKNAAWTLGNLACESYSIRLSILGQDGVLSVLVECLSKDENPRLQKNAAWALGNLACESDSIRLSISGQDGGLQGLVRALSKEKNPSLQKHAAWALCNLVDGPDSVRLRILGQDGALQVLVGMLSKEQNPELQTAAARTLGRLANGAESVMIQISGAHGALASLVEALSKDENPCLQKHAAWALGNLAKGQDTIKDQILGVDGALAGLVKSLSKDKNPYLQRNAAGALANLARGQDTIKLAILGQDGALQGMVEALSEGQNPQLQKHAAQALISLAMGGESTKLTIVNKDGLLAGLVGAYSKDNNPLLQKAVALALVKLSYVEDVAMKLKVRSEEGWLAALTKSAAKGDFEFQKEAKEALENLALDN